MIRLLLLNRFRWSIVPITLILLLGPGSVFALSLTITQVGGTAENGRGVVGDTIGISVDLVLEENEVLLAAFPTLMWDQEGGNVLNIRSVFDGPGAILGPYFLSPINSAVIVSTSTAPGGTQFHSDDGVALNDEFMGRTLMLGMEVAAPPIGDEVLFNELVMNGGPGPASFRLGFATFVLSAPGTTSIGFFLDPTSTRRTIFAGARGFEIDNDQVSFTDLDVSAIGFDSFQIEVVPEPSTALLVAMGLAVLGSKRRREHS